MTESDKKIASVAGVGLADLLLVLFVGLKLGGVIGWSWWWVLAPAWIPFVLVFVFVSIALILEVRRGYEGK